MVTAQTSDAELYEVLTSMLSGLGDSHTRVYWKKKSELFRSGNAKIVDYLNEAFAKQSKFTDPGSFRGDWAAKQQSFVQTLAEAPLARAAGDKLRYGKLKGNVGYLEIGSLSGFGPSGSTREQQIEILEHEMDRIVEEFRDCAAVIIDLSFNQGGADLFGAVIASRFADRRRLALRTYAHGQTIAEARSLFIDPAGPRQFTRPTLVLTTNATVSAGETLVLMLRAFPHVTQIGEVTRGCLSSLLNKGMPNAFHLTLSNEYWLSATGRLYEGKGIPPEVELRVFDPEDLTNSYPRAVRRTLELAVARSR
jgi:carboxyl-terminal processing protease